MNIRKPIEVCIIIDTEFSIGGNFDDPALPPVAEPMGAGFRRQAYAHQLSPVLILTHPQEYIKKTDFRYAILRRRRANQGRLRAVLKFLKQHENEFTTTPISAISDDGADS
jgi:hypothetical protein